MPVITIEGPKLNKEQKAELVKLVSQDTSKVTGIPIDAMVVLIKENDAENIGHGDCLLCDLQPK